MFDNLTHLWLVTSIDWKLQWDVLEGIQHLPKLTHLSLSMVSSSMDWDDVENVQLLVSLAQNILKHCKYLTVLVVSNGNLFDWGPTRQLFVPPSAAEIGDPRIVSLDYAYLRDWEDGSQGRGDMWTIAEAIVERQTLIQKPLYMTVI
ncbi:hypothetical protein BDN72DRAFT_903922 [Pluteus cervinus]|uniref:Uncharacterized protein n=1 Tax=Pluteus cervinus TaxID=181527 RepID=A0ACD3A7P0_9AGAR|nr:hypothetical protein BDN72DRAFT_903922 [Pluteus cervinus]